MGYSLCTAEKSSVAKDIARVVGATKSCDGYYEGNGYLVTWAVGHLVGLAEPEEYGFVSQEEMWSDGKDRAYAELPLIPKQWKLVVLKPTKRQFEIIKQLMHRPDVDRIIDCGDAGAEGHILQWFIREKAGCTKPVYRFCATSMTDEAIREAMNNLVNPQETIRRFMPIIRGEFCKKKADWIMGMSISRAESIKYQAGISVGRVQSPTLGFIVKRFLEVTQFKVTNYYTMQADVKTMSGGTFNVFWDKDADGVFSGAVKDGMNRVLDKNAVEQKAAEIKRGAIGTVTLFQTEKRVTERPQLYDIIQLQIDANKKYGYTAAATLAAAQALYETQKVLSYPRTDSCYLTSDLKEYLPSRLAAVGTIPKYAKAVKLLSTNGLNIDKRIIDDTKVTDHHGLIPMKEIQGFDPSQMQPTDEEKKKGVTSEMMQNVLDLILTRFIVALSPAYHYLHSNVVVTFPNGMKFTASGNVPVSMGWKEYQKHLNGKIEDAEENDSSEDTEQLFPKMQIGDKLSVSDCYAVSKKTTPPKLYTEATLLKAMKNAGQQIENGAILNGRGIGTQATRGDIIKKLFDTGVVETKQVGKTNYIVPTSKGISVIRVLPPELYSPKITADWETKIAQIADGTATEDDFMREFIDFITQKVEQVKSMDVANVTFNREKKVYGDCPFCHAPVYCYEKTENRKKIKTYYCSEKVCAFRINPDNPVFQARMKRSITESEVVKLLEKGAFVATCKRQSDGKPYKAEFSITKVMRKNEQGEEKAYCNIVCQMVKK